MKTVWNAIKGIMAITFLALGIMVLSITIKDNSDITWMGYFGSFALCVCGPIISINLDKVIDTMLD